MHCIALPAFIALIFSKHIGTFWHALVREHENGRKQFGFILHCNGNVSLDSVPLNICTNVN